MLVAIIDDGIDPLSGIEVVYDLSVAPDAEIGMRADPILTEHGTICAAIIKKYAPRAEFCSIRIFLNSTLKTSCAQMVAALKWCYERKIPIVHLSVGTSLLSDYASIQPVVAKMLKQRQIIIAAHSNREQYSLPACLGGVLGVSADKNLSDCKYVSAPNNRFIHASSRHELNLPVRGVFTTQIANSYAAPTVTAVVHNIIANEIPFSMTVSQVIRRVAADDDFSFQKPDFIEAAYIINPNAYPILERHLFFTCLGAHASLDESGSIEQGKCDLVYLAPFDSSNALAVARSFRASDGLFSGLLYGGTMWDSRFTLKHTLVWSEDSCRDILERHDYAQFKVECPIVCINGKGLESIDLLCRLRDLFMNDEYQCACVSDFPFSYLYGLEYVSGAVSGSSAIQHFHDTYQPDILLCAFFDASRYVDVIPDSFIVDVGQPADSGFMNDTHSANRYFVPVAFTDVDVLSVKMELERYFL